MLLPVPSSPAQTEVILTENTHTHTLPAVNAKKDEGYETINVCIMQFNVHRVLLPRTKNVLFFCHTRVGTPKYIFSTQKHTHTHWAQLEVYVSWDQAKGVQYQRAYIYSQAGRRQWTKSVCLSHIVWHTVKGHYYNSPFYSPSVPISFCYLSLSDHLSPYNCGSFQLNSQIWSLSTYSGTWKLVKPFFNSA